MSGRGSLSRGSSVQGGSLSRRSLWLSRGSLSLSRDFLCLCSWGSLSRGLCPDGSLSGGFPQTDPPCTVTSGQYASYWNAFLFLCSFQQKVCRIISWCPPGLAQLLWKKTWIGHCKVDLRLFRKSVQNYWPEFQTMSTVCEDGGELFLNVHKHVLQYSLNCH